MAISGNDGVIWLRGNNDKLYQQTIGNNYTALTLTSVQGTTPQLLFTGAPGYIITELGMQVDDISTIASAGMISTKFTDSSFGDFFVIRWYLPTSFAAKVGPQTNRVVNGPGFFFNNKTANSSVNVSVDTALTAGAVRFFARYALTSIVG